MSIESIIGITSGLIGIIGAVYAGTCWLRQKVKDSPTTDLFNQLTDKTVSDIERRNVLKKLNKSSLINMKIRDEYIQGFALEQRGREAVLFDICDYNDIEPNDDICKGLIGVCMPSLKKKYQEKRQSKQKKSSSAPIQNETTITTTKVGEQTVYLSDLLRVKFPEVCERLIRILEKHSVKYAFLKGTKDIWCRDYMPVQTESGKFIQFKYDPSYLKGNQEWENSRSDVKDVCRLNNIEALSSDINLDGGNVLICDGRAILTDRIFSENPNRDKEELVSELTKLLECEIIIIPSQKGDVTGHADGMVRFVNRNTILGNELAKEYKYWREGMQKVLEKYNLTYIDVPFFEAKDRKHPLSAVGIYVNYLEVNNLIVLPVFGRDEDKLAIDIIKMAFPGKIVETINYEEVAQEGGLLNCTTWVVR